jgi:HAE1 family hydrophobic/amphiphilic exporter-1
MNISEFCIRHPVATTLMSVALVAAGIFAYVFLPVAALPRTEFPVINVSASLPGASPDTMANAVATPLIKQFSTIAGIDTISATSAQGSTSIAVQFNLDRDIDAAAADVQSAIARVQRQLPTEMTEPPSYRKVNPADFAILILVLRSDIAPLPDLDAFAQQVISPALSTIDGVAQVQIFGSQKYAVRVQIDPDALAARGIGVDQVQDAVSAANANTPVGTLRNLQQSMTIQARTELSNGAQFRNIIVATPNGRPVRLGDLATVTDSVENNQTASWYNGTRAIILGVYRQPEANTVEVVDRVKALLPSFEGELPRATTLHVLNDRSVSIRNAVHDVELTLGLTIVLVILVIFLFLRRVTATVIPALAVPISLIATLAAMYVFNFSIDNISLLGLTLAVGLVVDDAIVMLENIYRHMEEEGLGAFEAALKGSREIGFTIMSITVSLVAVFIPVLLMGGIIGRIFNEFAVVVTTAIVASAFVSLTLTPMLSSKVLRVPEKGERQPRWSAFFERGFDAVLRGYDRTLSFSLRHQPMMLLVFFATLAGTAWLVVATPKGFFPQEDIGQLSVSTEARQDISFEAMVALQKRVAKTIEQSPHVANVASIVGSTGSSSQGLNNGRMFVELKPFNERPALSKVLAD